MKLLTSVVVAAALSVACWAADPAGVHNFQQVNDHVYRGAQPTTEGFRSLASIGVKTVIDLRETGKRSRDEQKIVEAAGMHYVSMPMDGLSAPSDAQIAKLLGLLDHGDTVFIHCRRGADRTGTVVACYRIAHDHWDNSRALTEARSMHMAWFEKAMQNYIMHYGAGTPSGTPAVAVAAAAN